MANVKIKNLSKSFDTKKILDDINLEINNEEFCVLVGPSGCGKSTLLRTIAGLENEDSGEIYFDEVKVNKIQPKDRDIAFVFQSYALYPHLSVFENIAFPLKIKGYKKEEALKVCHQYSRDNARTPMQWDDSEHAGFTSGQPWFYVNPNYTEINVKADMASEKSIYRFYKKLIALRKTPEYESVLVEGNTKPVYTEEAKIFAYERVSKEGAKVLVISNYQNGEQQLKLEQSFASILLNNYESLEIENGCLLLKPYQTIVVQ
jgi:glycosidase